MRRLRDPNRRWQSGLDPGAAKCSVCYSSFGSVTRYFTTLTDCPPTPGFRGPIILTPVPGSLEKVPAPRHPCRTAARDVRLGGLAAERPETKPRLNAQAQRAA